MNAELVAEPILEERPRRRGAWSRRCPHCLSSALETAPKGSLRCIACEAVLVAPNPRAPGPSHATALCHPHWEDDHRLVDGTWDRYSRRGELVAEWGRSTDRQDGGPPPADGEELEHMAPRVRAPAVLGRQDDVLDAAVREYVNETEALGDALGALKRLAIGLTKLRPPRPRPRTRGVPVLPAPARRTFKGADILIDGEKVGRIEDLEITYEEVVPDEQAHLFKSAEELADAAPGPAAYMAPEHPIPRWHAPLGEAVRVAMLSQLGALAILLSNALKRRGVPVDGTLDPVSPKARRSTPFAGYLHAMAAAFGVDEPGEASPIPKNAIAKHKLPSGVVFGRIACNPTRNYPAHAKEIPLDDRDVCAAIEAARVGARTFFDTASGRTRREPGRPIQAWEVRLVRLLDAGEERAEAHRSKRTKRIDRLAVERLSYEEALAKLRVFDGAPTTLRELKLAAKAVRKAIRLELEDRGLIPSAAGPVELDEDTDAPTPATRGARPKRAAGAFAGVGTAA